jgi:L-type amino acid transporter 6
MSMTSEEQHRLLEASDASLPEGSSQQTARDDEESIEIALSDHSPSGSSTRSSSSSNRPPRTLSNLNGLALVIGLQIGSGIFSAPSVVISKLKSPLLSVLAWFLAGMLVWTGAASFIELGIRIPRNGGIQEYLRHVYGDLYAFLSAWAWLIVSRPCAMAMVSLVFSEYFFKSISLERVVSELSLKAVALLAIFLITLLNCLGTNVGTGAATFFLILKIVGLGSVVGIGFVLMFTGFSKSEGVSDSILTTIPAAQKNIRESTETTGKNIWIGLGNLTDAILAALFAYGGWESVSSP